MSETPPFAYVAEKDGRWYGAIIGDRKDSVKRFYRSFAGYTIKPMATRADWLSYCEATPAFEARQP